MYFLCKKIAIYFRFFIVTYHHEMYCNGNFYKIFITMIIILLINMRLHIVYSYKYNDKWYPYQQHFGLNRARESTDGTKLNENEFTEQLEQLNGHLYDTFKKRLDIITKELTYEVPENTATECAFSKSNNQNENQISSIGDDVKEEYVTNKNEGKSFNQKEDDHHDITLTKLDPNWYKNNFYTPPLKFNNNPNSEVLSRNQALTGKFISVALPQNSMYDFSRRNIIKSNALEEYRNQMKSLKDAFLVTNNINGYPGSLYEQNEPLQVDKWITTYDEGINRDDTSIWKIFPPPICTRSYKDTNSFVNPLTEHALKKKNNSKVWSFDKYLRGSNSKMETIQNIQNIQPEEGNFIRKNSKDIDWLSMKGDENSKNNFAKDDWKERLTTNVKMSDSDYLNTFNYGNSKRKFVDSVGQIKSEIPLTKTNSDSTDKFALNKPWLLDEINPYVKGDDIDKNNAKPSSSASLNNKMYRNIITYNYDYPLKAEPVYNGWKLSCLELDPARKSYTDKLRYTFPKLKLQSKLHSRQANLSKINTPPLTPPIATPNSLYPNVLSKALEISLSPNNIGHPEGNLLSNVAKIMNTSTLDLAQKIVSSSDINSLTALNKAGVTKVGESFNTAVTIKPVANIITSVGTTASPVTSTQGVSISASTTVPVSVANQIGKLTNAYVTQSQSQSQPQPQNNLLQSAENIVMPNRVGPNVSNILDEVLDKLKNIHLNKACDGDDNDKPNGFSCDIIGLWSSQLLGICLDIQNGAQRHQDNSNVDKYSTLKIVPQDCSPPKQHNIIDLSWSFSGGTQNGKGGPFYMYAHNPKEHTLATFIGFCRTCFDMDTIYGSWTFAYPTKDCSDVYLAFNTRTDVFRRLTIEDKRRERYKNLLLLQQNKV